MAIAVTRFGEFEGKPVTQFTLKSDTGVEVDLIDYGVAVRDWRVPVKGRVRSVVLGFDNFPAYASHSPHLGSVVERILKKNPAKAKEVQVGFLALNKNGEYGAYCLQMGFNYAVHDASGNRLIDSKSNFR